MAARASSSYEDYTSLASFTSTLYEEMDKLAKKNSRDTISDVALTRVNRAIRDARAFAGPHDPYAKDLAEFIPAGDNPEVRDVVLVLGDIKAALERVRAKLQLGYRWVG